MELGKPKEGHISSVQPAAVAHFHSVEEAEHHWSKEGLRGKRDFRKERKDKGYRMFEEEDSEEELMVDSVRSPGKLKKHSKPSFKFPKREKLYKPRVNEKEEKKEKERDKEKEKERDKEKEKKEKEKEKEREKDKEKKEKEKEKEKEREKERKEKEKEKDKKDKKERAFKEPKVKEEKLEKPKWKKKKFGLAAEAAIPKVVEPKGSDVDQKVFGVPLAVAVERSKCHDGIQLPVVFRECIDYIEELGVKSKVQSLREAYNRGAVSVYLHEHEPNVVASLLKLYLRELPEPVLTTELMPKFEQASAQKNVKLKVEQFQELIEELPTPNRLLLSWIIVHMMHIIQREAQNKMSLQNVSIVLSPTMKISHRVLNVFFTYSKILFDDVVIKKYKPPLRPITSRWSLELPDSPVAIEEELHKQESLLNELHEELTHKKDAEKEEQVWEVQRVVTQLKRKLKLAKKAQEAAIQSKKREEDIAREKQLSQLKRASTDSSSKRSSQVSLEEKVSIDEERRSISDQSKSDAVDSAEAEDESEEPEAASGKDSQSEKEEEEETDKTPTVESQSIVKDVEAAPEEILEEQVITPTNEPEKIPEAPAVISEAAVVESQPEVKEAEETAEEVEEMAKGVEALTVEEEELKEPVVEDTGDLDVDVPLETESGAGGLTEEEEVREEEEEVEEEEEEEEVGRETEQEAEPEMPPVQVAKHPAEFAIHGEILQPVPAPVQEKSEKSLPSSTPTSSDSSEEEDLPEDIIDDEEFERLQEEYMVLVLEEEELLAIRDELKTKIETERSEYNLLQQEITEVQAIREGLYDSDELNSSASSGDSDDEDDLQDILQQLIKENEELEAQNRELCQKIHDERQICLGVKVQIRMIQQRQLESSADAVEMLGERDALL